MITSNSIQGRGMDKGHISQESKIVIDT
jgi:hypothetical protein